MGITKVQSGDTNKLFLLLFDLLFLCGLTFLTDLQMLFVCLKLRSRSCNQAFYFRWYEVKLFCFCFKSCFYSRLSHYVEFFHLFNTQAIFYSLDNAAKDIGIHHLTCFSHECCSRYFNWRHGRSRFVCKGSCRPISSYVVCASGKAL